MDDKQKSVCMIAISHYGEQHQIIKAVEEMSELTKELTKFMGYSLDGAMVNHPELKQRLLARISDEMADVEVVMEQLKMIFGNSVTVEQIVGNKLMRLRSRMEG